MMLKHSSTDIVKYLKKYLNKLIMKVLVVLRDFLKNLMCCHSSCMNQTIENNIMKEVDEIRTEIKELTQIMNLLLTRRP